MKVKAIIAFTICLLSMITLSACFSDYNKILESNWGILLPKGYKELYSTDSGDSFLGDGQRYHVFDYEEKLKQEEIEKFSSKKNIKVEEEAEGILIQLGVSKEKRPNFSKEYYWYKKVHYIDSRSNLYLIYVFENSMVYVIEEFY